MFGMLLAVALNLQKSGVAFTLETETETIDLGRNVRVTLMAKAPSNVEVTLPDLTTRLRGFTDAESLEAEPVRGKDGQVTRSVEWKLVPEPCAPEYRIAPFVVTVMTGDKDASFIAGPVRFDPPAAVDSDGEIVIHPEKDKPVLTWKRVGRWLLWTLGILVGVVLPLVALVRYLVRRVKEHRMRPIDRAWAELGRLVARRLPARGRYKDFYVELTMVVRRYVQRKYGIRAPHLTTEEFLHELAARRDDGAGNPAARYDLLNEFLSSADLVKFAGVEATPELAEDAVSKARGYLSDDDSTEVS